MPELLDAIPEHYSLHYYDECGVPERQPHVDMTDCYCWTFNTSDTDADFKSRSAVFSYKEIRANYNRLDPARSWIVAVTYANDHVYRRIQSLEANGVVLHGPRPIASGRAERLIVSVPAGLVCDGQLALRWKIHGEVNATVSVIELWADAPAPESLHIVSLSGLVGDLRGRVLDLAYDPVASATVELRRSDESITLAQSETDGKGWFHFPRRAFEHGTGPRDLVLTSRYRAARASVKVPARELSYEPVRYVPMPAAVDGLETAAISLDGQWHIHTDPPPNVRDLGLGAAGWGVIQVPGQWLQQGYEVPQDRTVAMATEFRIPPGWPEQRIMLRFDAIHAGTRYWLNGHLLGESEILFSPVEWDITDFVRPGQSNRLDLSMKVATDSERLSHASGYAFHNLGGIDRSVRVHALPPAHVNRLHIDASLDSAMKDGSIRLRLSLANKSSETVTGISVALTLTGPDGATVDHTAPETIVGTLEPGSRDVTIATMVATPLPWSCEKPNLYSLSIELRRDGRPCECIERRLGFRNVEIRNRQLYVNGSRVKLAGACRHEIDPLTGRADTARYAETDVQLLRAANLNYIRTAHYPPTEELLDAADRLGMYVEVEAPFCWVAPREDMADLRRILDPTGAMVDFCHTHPSVIIWSLANESHFNPDFEAANDLVRRLDPSRPTTFNNPDPERVCDIGNLHYAPMPYDEQGKDDPRPMLLGEYFFPVCHEMTDVDVNPGLRELWGHGHADPASAWARECARAFDAPFLAPGARPGFWTHLWNSERYIGGAIWAALDEPFYLPGGKHAGYAWVHGFWGLIDGWRRPKPEWALARHIFSPVWFPERQVEFTPAQKELRVPVENRYSFTDLRELSFDWELCDMKGRGSVEAAPGATGELSIALPPAAMPGDRAMVRVHGRRGQLITEVAVHLGKENIPAPPQPCGKPPDLASGGRVMIVRGENFGVALDPRAGDVLSSHSGHRCTVTTFPAIHLTRFDFNDLAGPKAPPYAVFPDPATRVVESFQLKKAGNGVEMTVQDRYDCCSGTISWLLDAKGVGRIRYDYEWTSETLKAREIGVKLGLERACDELSWKRWSEWGVFPEDSICRVEGKARALRDGKPGRDPEGVRPSWPWMLDQTELGTNDFRGVKFNIVKASLLDSRGKGVRVHAQADAHVRACLQNTGVALHILRECRLGPVVVKPGDRLKGEFCVQLCSCEEQ